MKRQKLNSETYPNGGILGRDVLRNDGLRSDDGDDDGGGHGNRDDGESDLKQV